MIKPKSKIAIISQSLGGGGAERFAGTLSIMLTDMGHEIHHIIIENKIDFEFTGVVLNLGTTASNLSKIAKARKIRSYLASNQIDTIIDNRPRNSFIRDFASKLIFGNRIKIYIIHSFNLQNYLPKSRFLAGILYRNAYKIICVSKAIEDKVQREYGFFNTQTIYNSVDLSGQSFSSSKLPEKFILFFGRLDEKVKNFTLLLDAFALSAIYKKGYKLLIMGDGPDRNLITQKIENLNLDQEIKITPFQKNPYNYVKNAAFTVLTSNYEGFPMSLIESLALGTPVVSVDCASGPSEIIINGKNGLLVPNQNVNALANALSKLADDHILYDICKANAAESVAHLSPQIIAAQWRSVLTQQNEN